jgi:hypothetical protein
MTSLSIKDIYADKRKKVKDRSEHQDDHLLFHLEELLIDKNDLQHCIVPPDKPRHLQDWMKRYKNKSINHETRENIKSFLAAYLDQIKREARNKEPHNHDRDLIPYQRVAQAAEEWLKKDPPETMEDYEGTPDDDWNDEYKHTDTSTGQSARERIYEEGLAGIKHAENPYDKSPWYKKP